MRHVPDSPITFKSGKQSTLYCDNRLLLGNVQARRIIIDSLADLCEGVDTIAGIATGGLAWSAWVAADEEAMQHWRRRLGLR
jgi:orotate phosphoribosyltransferase